MTLISKINEPARVTPVRSAGVAGEGQLTGLYRRTLKRPLDVVLVLLAAPLWVPIIGLFAVLVALDGGSPFYSQLRIGRDGRHYRMWKLRSMVVDADAELERLLARDPLSRAEWDVMQKLTDDPRVTRLGRFLRKSSFDELPQFWNVLRGDMSLVGPRPMMPSQSALYLCTSYYRLRPGVTGPWQVSDRNEASFAERARFDRDYEERLSFAWDLRLMVATLRVILTGTGR